MTAKEPNFLGLFAREATAITLKAGDTLFKEGDEADCAYVLLSGEVQIAHGGAVLDRLSPGDMVGEMALLDHGPRSATVIASTDSALARIDERRFLSLVQQTPSFALDVMRLMSQRIRRMNDILN